MSRIERWTRKLLETEARKRGVRDAELRSGPDLLRAILAHDYGARQSLRNARKLVTSILPLFGNKSTPARQMVVPKSPAPTSLPTPPPAPPPSEPSVTKIPVAFVAGDAAPGASPSRIGLQREHAELKLSWQVNEADAQRARTLLGHPGELALRVVTVRSDPATIVHSEITEHGPLAASGAWTLLLSTPDANCVGAIGLRHGERFVSIVHESSRAAPAS